MLGQGADAETYGAMQIGRAIGEGHELGEGVRSFWAADEGCVSDLLVGKKLMCCFGYAAAGERGRGGRGG